VDTFYTNEKFANSFLNVCDEILKILSSILASTRKQLQNNEK